MIDAQGRSGDAGGSSSRRAGGVSEKIACIVAPSPSGMRRPGDGFTRQATPSMVRPYGVPSAFQMIANELRVLRRT